MRQQFAEREINEKGVPQSIPLFVALQFAAVVSDPKTKSHRGGAERAKAGKIRSSMKSNLVL